ncbi:hypothetical protein JH25_27975 [Pseudomonas sp. BRG-100]|uniref:hypothetical protein n=1 Tax=Pseudomonas sp. BRG-100 TaxID=1524267 RepID=UPI0004E6EE65|nr:hypothetical protein [Pseudomonas sp. BRG-100]KFF42204.1 hypothetical protein JH25_27975 [Pseudomonas sp. BRG-100]
MKQRLNLAASVFAAMLLSGCSILDAIETIRGFGSDPLVVASENPGATKASIMAVGAKPIKTQPTQKIQGMCYDFNLNNGDKTSPYYIAFNKKDQVVAYSFTTCADAESKGVINNEIPYVERKK